MLYGYSGKLFHVAAAECLKQREAKTEAVLDSVNKCLSDERKVREGS